VDSYVPPYSPTSTNIVTGTTSGCTPCRRKVSRHLYMLSRQQTLRQWKGHGLAYHLLRGVWAFSVLKFGAFKVGRFHAKRFAVYSKFTKRRRDSPYSLLRKWSHDSTHVLKRGVSS